MAKSDYEDLPTLQREVQRLLGRCILRVQQFERLSKAIVAGHKVSGPVDDLEPVMATRIDATAGKTLGNLVCDLIGSYVVADKIDPTVEMENNSPENINSFAMQITITLPGTEFDRVERELRELVQLRNNLVHHFFDQHDLETSDGCRAAQDALVSACNRIDQQFEQLRDYAKDTVETRHALSEILQSEKFKDALFNGVSADEKVDWNASGIVSVLQEAFSAVATDGWASIDVAAKWIAKRCPKELPAKYGCSSWRQVVHSVPHLELRYFEFNGQRIARYREKDCTAMGRSRPLEE